MNCKLYYNKSDNRVIHKTITQVGNTMTVLLKDNTEIVSPTIILSIDANSLAFNYVYLEDLRRYYYVTNITLSQQRMYVELKVDVLMSFANEIMLQSVILERQENQDKYNTYYHDNLTPKLSYDMTDTVVSSVKNKLDASVNYSYILVTAGG